MARKQRKWQGWSLLLVAELAFGVLYIGSCELPNWMVGPRSTRECQERWFFTAALLFPSGAQQATERGDGAAPKPSRQKATSGKPLTWDERRRRALEEVHRSEVH